MRELIGLEVLLNGKSIKTPYLIVAINAARNSPRIRLLRNIWEFMTKQNLLFVSIQDAKQLSRKFQT
jgi:hypothetical protein